MAEILLSSWLLGAASSVNLSEFEPPFSFWGDPGAILDRPPLFPILDAAIESLERRQILRQRDLWQLQEDAKRAAFTVARIHNTEVLAEIKQALLEDMARGGTLAQFQTKLAKTALSKSHLETIYRTQIATAYTQGLVEILDHPLIRDEFPYLRYTASQDERTRPEHRAMETYGLNGTAIYRRDDPVMILFLPPWSYNCRCTVIPLSIEQAASHGVREAIQWLDQGFAPSQPTFVRPPPFSPPRNFVGPGRTIVRLGMLDEAYQ